MVAPSILSVSSLETGMVRKFLFASEIMGWLSVAGSTVLVVASTVDSRDAYSSGWLAIAVGVAAVLLAGLMAYLIFVMFRHLHRLTIITRYDRYVTRRGL